MQLRESKVADIEQLRVWFGDAASLRDWGGPSFRFPSSRKSFAEDCKWQSLDSWSADGTDGQLLAFGQAYPKLGRAHLARIALAPDARGRQLGSALVQSLVAVATSQLMLANCALYVWRENSPAVHCYQRCGFEEHPHEENLVRAGVSASDIEQMMYMVRIPKG